MIFNYNKTNILVFIFILTGIILRLIWTEDMEWKSDEQWNYEHAQDAMESGNWGAVGMESSAGIVNPGLSAWIFTILSYISSTPVEMAQCVKVINIIVLLGFVLFAMKRTTNHERTIWLWGLALASVSPLAVLFSRKIWDPDVIVLFSLITIIGNSFRTKRAGAFFWGIAGAMAGQIHLSGFYYAFGIFIFTILYDVITKTKTRYWWWVAGSIIGSLGLIPWVNYILDNPHDVYLKWIYIFRFGFYIYWMLDGLGINIIYSMHGTFWEFIKLPYIGGIPLYLLGIIHLFLAAVGVVVIKRIYLYIKNKILILNTKEKIKDYIKNLSLSEFYLLSILLGLGIFLNFSGVYIYHHYLIIGFPFAYIFLAKVLMPYKKLLLSVIIAQLIITISFLIFVHIHDGVIKGDYGRSYISQDDVSE
jgi:hypothetical protein